MELKRLNGWHGNPAVSLLIELYGIETWKSPTELSWS